MKLFYFFILCMTTLSLAKSAESAPVTEKQDEAIRFSNKKSEAAAELLKEHYNFWMNIKRYVSDLKNKEGVAECEKNLELEFKKWDRIAYDLNRIAMKDIEPDQTQLRQIFSKTVPLLQEIGKELDKLSEKTFFGSEKIPTLIMMQGERRSVYTPVLGASMEKFHFPDNLNKEESAINDKCDKCAAVIMSLEGSLRQLTAQNAEKQIADIKKEAELFDSNKNDILIFCGGEYKSKNMNFSLYVCKRMRYLMDNLADQYLILKSKKFLGSEELKKSLSPLEKGVEDFYKNALFSQESMEDISKQRLPELKEVQKGVFYE